MENSGNNDLFSSTPIPRAKKIIPEEQTLLAIMSLYKAKDWLAKKGRDKALLELIYLCENQDESNLVIDLLSRLFYMAGNEKANCLDLIKSTIVDTWKLQSHNTKIVSTSDSQYTDGSQSFLWQLHECFGHDWTKRNFINAIGEGVRSAQDNDNIILIDDFIGTGSTMRRRVEWFNSKLNDRNITNVSIGICALAAMEFSKVILDGLGIKYFASKWLQKGITDHYDNNTTRTKALNNMLRLESLLKLRSSNLSLGFNKSEALYAQEHGNTPNNVFPIFWVKQLRDNTIRNTILSRTE